MSRIERTGMPMTGQDELAPWSRPYWRAGSEQALLHFYVFGKFAPEPAIPTARYGNASLPAGVRLERFQNAVLRQWEGYPLCGELGATLREDSPETFASARAAPEVLVVRGELEDAATLDYLRHTLGVLAALLDVGATSILDPQMLRLFSAAEWRGHYLVKGGAPLRNHVLILLDPDAEHPGRSWVRTRGMQVCPARHQHHQYPEGRGRSRRHAVRAAGGAGITWRAPRGRAGAGSRRPARRPGGRARRRHGRSALQQHPRVAALAGLVQEPGLFHRHSRARGNLGLVTLEQQRHWIPACAGMTTG